MLRSTRFAARPGYKKEQYPLSSWSVLMQGAALFCWEAAPNPQATLNIDSNLGAAGIAARLPIFIPPPLDQQFISVQFAYRHHRAPSFRDNFTGAAPANIL